MEAGFDSEKTQETKEKNGMSYRIRPRKCTCPRPSPFNSCQDLYRFPAASSSSSGIKAHELHHSRQTHTWNHVGLATSSPKNLDIQENPPFLMKKDPARKKSSKKRPRSAQSNKGRAKTSKLYSVRDVTAVPMLPNKNSEDMPHSPDQFNKDSAERSQLYSEKKVVVVPVASNKSSEKRPQPSSEVNEGKVKRIRFILKPSSEVNEGKVKRIRFILKPKRDIVPIPVEPNKCSQNMQDKGKAKMRNVYTDCDVNSIPMAPKKTSKKRSHSDMKERRAKKPKIHSENDDFPDPAEARLPVEFVDKIRGLGFSRDPILVIQKPLYATDVSTGHQRLSIPESQVLNLGFLTEAESKRLNKNEEILCVLIDPSLVQWRIKMKKWYMGRCGQFSLIYPWNQVVKTNGLQKDMRVQVWSFRNDEELYMVLVRL